MTLFKPKLILLLLSTLLLAACEIPFLGDEEAKIEARREAEGRAIGSACRHAGRPIEDCYERSPKTSKAAIFAGWRDMDGYMRENNIQVVAPEQPESAAKQSSAAPEAPKAAEAPPPEEKGKAAEAAHGKKTAEGPKEAPAKPGASTPGRGKQLNHIA